MAVTPEMQQHYKQELGLEKFGNIVFVTGGGQGSQRLNDFVIGSVPRLLSKYEDLAVIHIAGKAQKETVQTAYRRALKRSEQDRVFVEGFVTELWKYSGAADVVVARAGATTVAELAIQRKATVIVPNPFLTAGHQIKTAQILAEHQAALCVSEQRLAKTLEPLTQAVESLLDNAGKRRSLATQLGAFAQPRAAHEIAKLLLQQTDALSVQSKGHKKA
jgi:UDP-N-acetylglucosamine--N-acetylmuramyl-(pentapeptide) pyrophosphoryl-undecaprenol N-acetylglucosamine transferase